MKNLFKSMICALLGVFALSSCEDVPAPYPTPGTGGSGSDETVIYESKSLNAGWTVIAATPDDPWSLGNNYAQATGFKDWDESGTKTNREVRGYLVSPPIKTKSSDGKVKFTFDNCLMYASNDPQYAQHCRVLVSNYYEGDPTVCNWLDISDFKPTPAAESWKFTNAGEFQLPEDLVNQENVVFAFYFEAPANKSTTWEVQNFKVMEGEAVVPEPIIVETEGDGTLENPYTVADALALINAGVNTADEVYVKGIVSQLGDDKGEDKPGNEHGNATYFISDDGTTTNQFEIFRGNGLGGEKIESEDYLKINDNVIVHGVLTLYNKTPEMAQGSEIVELNGQKPEVPDFTGASGSGTKEDPYNVVGALQLCSTLQKTTDSKNPYYSEEIYVKGTISKIDEVSLQNGNATYYIVDFDATTGTPVGDDALEIYRGKYLGGADFTAEDQIKTNDEVLIKGKLQNFRGTYEFAAGSIIVMLNGQEAEEPSEGGESGGGDEPGTDPVAGFTITAANIASGGKDLTTNNYGSQAVATESTWYKFTVNGAGFVGCKICNATAANGGGIQMQGNDSDKSKQGFITNVTPFLPISKVILVARTKSDAQYEPSFSFYVGTESHPSGSAIQSSAKSVTEEGGFKIYTYTFNVFDLNGDYSYFTIANDKAGALYIDSFTVETK